MDVKKEQEEKLREAACKGDEDAVCALLEKGVLVNTQHAINGWTPLHWAAKRGHTTIITRLLQNGASPTIQTVKGETAAELATDPTIQRMLGGEVNGNTPKPELPIQPHYLAHPSFPYVNVESTKYRYTQSSEQNQVTSAASVPSRAPQPLEDDELVLKARLAGTGDPDFIEVELPRTNLSFDNLLSTLARELNVDQRAVQKVRKLPNTIVRKDKDVRRLHDFQEIEIILTTYAVSQHSRNTGGPTPRHIDVVY